MVNDGLGGHHQTISLSLQRGKHNTAEQSPLMVQNAVAAVLNGNGAPFAVFLVDENVRISGATEQISAWFQGPDYWACVSPVMSAAPGHRCDVLCSEDEDLEKRCCEAFTAVRQYEENHKHISSLSSQTLDIRPQHVKCALAYGSRFGFKEETIQDALLLFDRVVATGLEYEQKDAQLIVCVCILMVGRLCEDHGILQCPDSLPELTGFSTATVSAMESRVRSTLGDDIRAISTLRIILLFLERIGTVDERTDIAIRSLVQQMLPNSSFLQYRPSVVGAAVLFSVRKQQGLYPFWPSALMHMTGYSPRKDGAFADCIKLIDCLNETPRQASLDG